MFKANCLVVLLLFGLTSSVEADSRREHDRSDDDKNKKHEKYEKHDKRGKYNKMETRDHFIDEDRFVVRSYYMQNPSSLPPGLAKRGGSLPPGLAKRGGKLPPGLSRGQVVTPEHHAQMLPLPPKLEVLLPPPPHEVIRRILGHDIVMINKQTNKVLDVLHDALPH